jgi:hypothetical protein
VEAAARRVPGRVSCLHKSLTLWWLLRRRGVGAELRVGVRKPGSRLEAHAWVERDGMVLNDDPDVRQRFSSFDRAIGPAGVGNS